MINTKFTINGRVFENRAVFQPMEACDCNFDGSPSELTIRKYMKAARSGVGTVWFEANAVTPEGRTGKRQMMLTEGNLESFKRLIDDMREASLKECGIRQIYILQLTHSGRQSIKPMIAYRHPIYEKTRPVTDENIVSDDYLSALPELYRKSAELAIRAGFDGIDVKSCHGYLFQELLSAFTRDGRYGGSFENRTKLFLNTLDAVKDLPTLLTSRLSVTDMIEKPYGFGTDEEGNIDFEEPDMLIERIIEKGVSILNVTVGNPYFNPHVNRPYRQGGYKAPESAETGLRRFEEVEGHIKDKFPALAVVASGLSYYRDNLMDKSNEILERGIADFVGFGRGWIAYPNLYRDYLKGEFDGKKCCVACSKCTALMRAGEVSGCAAFDPYYKELYKEKIK